jgi:hypothetical protein
MEARISRKKSLPLSLPPSSRQQENNNERIMNLNNHQQTTMHLSMLDNLEQVPPSSHKDAYLSSTGREGMKNLKGPISSAPNTPETLRKGSRDKKEKMEFNQMMLRSLSRPLSYHGSICLDHPHHNNTPLVPVVNKRHIASSRGRKDSAGLQANRRSMPYSQRDKIDVSELDTNLPRIDMEVIETHLRQAREEERKVRRKLFLYKEIILNC